MNDTTDFDPENSGDGAKITPSPVKEPHRWKPGQSGNPSGLPKNPAAEVTLCRQMALERSPQAIDVLTQIMMNPKSKESARVRCAEVILERGLGKSVQPVLVDTNNDYLSILERIGQRMKATVIDCIAEDVTPKNT